MNPQLDTAPFELVAVGWLMFVAALLAALRSPQRVVPRSDAVEHAWLGGAVFVSLLWMAQIRLGGAPALGMLGSALYALVFGYSRGLLGLALALVLHTALAGGSWLGLGIDGVLLAVVPSAVATMLRQQIERRLPRNPFVFMIGNGMFSTLAAIATARLAQIAVSWLTGTLHPALPLETYLGAALLLAWSEAIVSGMLLSALVVFRPQIVLTFREELYGA